MLSCVFFYSHFTSIEMGDEVVVPRSFSALQRYCPESEDWMVLKESCCPWTLCPGGWPVVTLVQVYFATGLASLVQVRFTELPSSITPGGVTPTEGVSGASVDSYISLVIKLMLLLTNGISSASSLPCTTGRPTLRLKPASTWTIVLHSYLNCMYFVTLKTHHV